MANNIEKEYYKKTGKDDMDEKNKKAWQDNREKNRQNPGRRQNPGWRDPGV